MHEHVHLRVGGCLHSSMPPVYLHYSVLPAEQTESPPALLPHRSISPPPPSSPTCLLQVEWYTSGARWRGISADPPGGRWHRKIAADLSHYRLMHHLLAGGWQLAAGWRLPRSKLWRLAVCQPS